MESLKINIDSLAVKNENLRRMITSSMLEKEFNYISSAFFLEELVLKTLRGEIVGCNFKHHLSAKVCNEIVQRFWNSPELKSRGDEVKAYQLGAFHYRKPLEEYLDEAEVTNKALQSILGDTVDPVSYVIDRLKEHFNEQGIEIRQAEHLNKKAGKFIIRSAKPTPEGVILPHEDMAQCMNALQKDFEIQGVSAFRILGVNICLQNDNKGKLRCWNMKPNDLIRAQLNVTDSGYPYPADMLEDVVSIDVPINVGDIYFFDASHVHAVISEPNAKGYRTTISFFLGFINNNTVVYWT